MKTTVYKADQRGYANHGWLEARHSFSFASWFNPDQMNFGMLRVLNDDIIAPGAGFPTHPHENMEIITIPLSGTLEHKDSMGNIAQVNTGEVQVMSAGTGVTHSEYNASKDEELRLFQIWIFPDKQNIQPRYGQISIDNHLKNQWKPIITPEVKENTLTLNQWVYMNIADVDKDVSLNYESHSASSGLFVMVVEGTFNVNGIDLGYRDAIGVEGFVNSEFVSKSVGRLLLIEVLMD
jgi:hypothetical protein